MKFMNLSGSPVLLLPRSLAPSWRGFYVPADPDDEFPDLELSDGSGWQIDDTFDFQQPRTDYDRLCAMQEDPSLVPIGDGHGVAFVQTHDSFAWCDEHKEIVGGGSAPESREGLVWEPRFTWRNPDHELLLMNACEHGADPTDNLEFVDVQLAPGLYEVATAEPRGRFALTLCRFRLM
jgi:hypothetical protein